VLSELPPAVRIGQGPGLKCSMVNICSTFVTMVATGNAVGGQGEIVKIIRTNKIDKERPLKVLDRCLHYGVELFTLWLKAETPP